MWIEKTRNDLEYRCLQNHRQESIFCHEMAPMFLQEYRLPATYKQKPTMRNKLIILSILG